MGECCDKLFLDASESEDRLSSSGEVSARGTGTKPASKVPLAITCSSSTGTGSSERIAFSSSVANTTGTSGWLISGTGCGVLGKSMVAAGIH